jgi:hypothetical protein
MYVGWFILKKKRKENGGNNPIVWDKVRIKRPETLRMILSLYACFSLDQISFDPAHVKDPVIRQIQSQLLIPLWVVS